MKVHGFTISVPQVGHGCYFPENSCLWASRHQETPKVPEIKPSAKSGPAPVNGMICFMFLMMHSKSFTAAFSLVSTLVWSVGYAHADEVDDYILAEMEGTIDSRSGGGRGGQWQNYQSQRLRVGRDELFNIK